MNALLHITMPLLRVTEVIQDCLPYIPFTIPWIPGGGVTPAQRRAYDLALAAQYLDAHIPYPYMAIKRTLRHYRDKGKLHITLVDGQLTVRWRLHPHQ